MSEGPDPRLSEQLFVCTPLVESLPLSQLLGVPVYLKLENVHPSGSFKLRGISRLCQKAVSEGCTTLVTSSGGNAGLAVSYCAHRLGVKAKVVVSSNVPAAVRQRLEDDGAEVEVHGSIWNHANERALIIAQETTGAIYVHPFDHPDIWEGHGTMVDEMAAALGPGVIPSCIVASVGGGGLACGILGALPRVGWEEVPLLAMETQGADCFNQSVKAGRKIIMPGITSVATCLGSVVPCDKILYYLSKRRIISEVVSDRAAVDACLKFADDHRYLVEPACGATLASVYHGLISSLRRNKTLKMTGSSSPVILIVCGGSGASLSQLAEWKKHFGL